LSRNHIKIIQETALSKLVNLEIVDFSLNELQEFPMGVTSSNHLKRLQVTNNHIGLIPPEFFTSTAAASLVELNISANPIKELSPNIIFMHTLEVLGMSNTQIEIIPREIYELQEHLKIISVEYTPLKVPKYAMAMKGVKAIMKFFAPNPNEEVNNEFTSKKFARTNHKGKDERPGSPRLRAAKYRLSQKSLAMPSSKIDPISAHIRETTTLDEETKESDETLYQTENGVPIETLRYIKKIGQLPVIKNNHKSKIEKVHDLIEEIKNKIDLKIKVSEQSDIERAKVPTGVKKSEIDLVLLLQNRIHPSVSDIHDKKQEISSLPPTQKKEIRNNIIKILEKEAQEEENFYKIKLYVSYINSYLEEYLEAYNKKVALQEGALNDDISLNEKIELMQPYFRILTNDNHFKSKMSSSIHLGSIFSKLGFEYKKQGKAEYLLLEKKKGQLVQNNVRNASFPNNQGCDNLGQKCRK